MVMTRDDVAAYQFSGTDKSPPAYQSNLPLLVAILMRIAILASGCFARLQADVTTCAAAASRGLCRKRGTFRRNFVVLYCPAIAPWGL